MDNLTPINPAYAMFTPGGSVNTMVRNQWAGVEGSPTSFMFSGKLPINAIHASAGVFINTNKVTVENLSEFNAFFAKSIQLGKTEYIALSVNAGLKRYAASYTSLDQTDPTFNNNVNQSKPNIGLGVMFYSNNYYVGISAPEISAGNSSTDVDNSNFKSHYYFAAGFTKALGDGFKLKPATLVSYMEGVPVVADFSTILYVKQVVGIGVNYRTTNEIAPILSFEAESFHLGYSYQFGVNHNNIAGFSNATHEITLSLTFGK
jgi:type IX secretion system PorP/SprF family membrane protein